MKASAIFLVIVFFVGTAFNCKSSDIIPSSVNFSECTITTHQKVGILIAKNAKLASVDVSDSAHLENTTTSGLLDVLGKLTCKNCKLESVTKIGSGEIEHTTIQNQFRSTGSTTARTCSFSSYNGCGPLHFEGTTVEQKIKNIGHTTLVGGKCHALGVTGSVDARDIACENADITGKTTLTNSTINGKANIVGKTKISTATIINLVIVGQTTATHLEATTIDVTGNLDAKTVDCEKLTLATKESTLSDCSIDTLFVKKQKHGIKITIYNSPKAPQSLVRRIICEDPRTQIVYKDNSLRAEEISGTQRVTPVVPAQ